MNKIVWRRDISRSICRNVTLLSVIAHDVINSYSFLPFSYFLSFSFYDKCLKTNVTLQSQKEISVEDLRINFYQNDSREDYLNASFAYDKFTELYVTFLRDFFKDTNSMTLFALSLLDIYFFYVGILSRTFTIRRTAGGGEAITVTPVYHFHPLHKILDISRAITSPLHIARSRTQTGNFLFPSANR